uniref:Uncharacterized protein n=1 Tax=Ananas comosus var. bracteatus TaxID=296719 RepID=A0A6V7P9F8_ANACO|nr:unnamed protein product [Ananas comosus var. bracteatus]
MMQNLYLADSALGDRSLAAGTGSVSRNSGRGSAQNCSKGPVPSDGDRFRIDHTCYEFRARGRSLPSGDALRSFCITGWSKPEDGLSGRKLRARDDGLNVGNPSGKVGDVGAEPTGNFVVVLTPLFHRAGTEQAGERPR